MYVLGKKYLQLNSITMCNYCLQKTDSAYNNVFFCTLSFIAVYIICCAIIKLVLVSIIIIIA